MTLNKLIFDNQAFLQQRFKIKNMSIELALANNVLPNKLKKAWFDNKISPANVFIQYEMDE
jgi:hypothetical protein